MIIDFFRAKREKELKKLSDREKLLVNNVNNLLADSKIRLLELNNKSRKNIKWFCSVVLYLEVILYLTLKSLNITSLMAIIIIIFMVLFALSPFVIMLFLAKEKKEIIDIHKGI